MSKTISLRYPIQINAGTVLEDAPNEIDFVEKHYEVLMGLGKDHTISMYIAESVINDNPHLFTIE